MPDITWVGCDPGNYQQGRDGQTLDTLVIHLAIGSQAGTDDFFNQHRPQNPTSAHFSVSDNAIHQYVDLADTAYSNGRVILPNVAAASWLADYANGKLSDVNRRCASIEFAGDHVWSNGVGSTIVKPWQPSPAQYANGLWLARKILREHPTIQAVRSHILRHSDINSATGPLGKWFCPGPGWPHASFLADLHSERPPLYVDYNAAKAKLDDPKISDFSTISPAVFAAVLREWHSPVADQALALFQICVDHWKNPAWFLAFFIQECSAGTDPNGLFAATNNPGNIAADHGLGQLAVSRYYAPWAKHYFRVYRNVLDGCLDWCNLWNLDVYTQHEGQPQELLLMLREYDEGDYQGYHDRGLRRVREWLDRSGSFSYPGPQV